VARTVDPERIAARREEIVLAAGRLFAEQGFEGTTAAQIAKAVGLSAGSVFYYFTSKRAVFRAVFESDIPVSRALVERCAAELDPVAAILTMVDELAAEAVLPHARGMVVELLRQVDRDPELAEVVMTNAGIVHAGLTALVQRGIVAGTVDVELAPDEAAAWIQTIVDSAYVNADPARDPRPMLRRIVSRFLAPTGESQ
jgi:TetR/AcrR family transcriptional regulator, transcriptional repressor of aconitase